MELSWSNNPVSDSSEEKQKQKLTTIPISWCGFLRWLREACADLHWKNVLIILAGAAVTAFGIYNVHDVADITEGGVLGLNLLLLHWFGISPAITNFVLTAVCFFIGWRVLGKSFIVNSAIAVLGFSAFYALFERTPRLFPQIAHYPWLAALLGALFVGVGAGLSVSENAAQSGDDALAMSFHAFFHVKVSTVYLVSDFLVLLLSLSYIPLRRILCSVLTVVLSGQLIEFILHLRKKRQQR